MPDLDPPHPLPRPPRPRPASRSSAPLATPARSWSGCWPGIPSPGLTLATGSQSGSAPRRLPALARVWDGEVRAARRGGRRPGRGGCLPGAARAASAEVAPQLLAGGARVIDLWGRSACVTTPPAPSWYPATKAFPAGVVYGLTEFAATRSRGRRWCVPGLLPDGVAAGTAAARPRAGLLRPTPTSSSTRSPASRRRQSADRSHALLARTTAASPPTARSAIATRRNRTGPRLRRHLHAASRPARPRPALDRFMHGSRPAPPRRRSPTAFTAAHATSPFVRLTGDTCRRSSTSPGPTSATSAGAWTRQRAASSSSSRLSTTW